MSTITLTFGEQAENHKGMQIIGDGLAYNGFTLKEMRVAKTRFEDAGYVCEYFRLDKEVRDEVAPTVLERATVLVVRKGANALLSSGDCDDLQAEQEALNWDSKVYMYGRVVNKKARHNLCYGNHAQEPDYENGKGRVIQWSEIPLTKEIKETLPTFMGSKADHIQGEGNLYYDLNKCGIGFHGDSERKMVMAVRLGESMRLQYQWYCEGEEIGSRIEFDLHHGDFYVMSEKATGHDWKRRKIPTLRHAAGCDKFLK